MAEGALTRLPFEKSHELRYGAMQGSKQLTEGPTAVGSLLVKLCQDKRVIRLI